MIITIKHKQNTIAYRIFSAFLAFTFIFSSVIPPQRAQAQTILNLPLPGAMVPLSPAYIPTMIKGIMIDHQNPLQFDFIIDTGDASLEGEEFNDEATKLIKYFLASLTLKEEEMWVNLSPYERNRIIPESFGQTEMGRDLLVQDYLLKQLTASLIYPEDELGKAFWDRVYSKAQAQFGTTEIPMNTFNKVWIVPESANVYEHEKGAFVVNSHLKVMLEEDYLAMDFHQKSTARSRGPSRDVALESNVGNTKHGLGDITQEDMDVISGVSSEIVREILIPEIEREVNEGKTFANLRQIFNSMILATWYKQNLKESFLSQVYVNKNRIKGVDQQDSYANQQIYEQYVEAFEKGVYNYIKEDYDPATQQLIPRRYFSGGVVNNLDDIVTTIAVSSPLDINNSVKGALQFVEVDLEAHWSDADQSEELAFASSPVENENENDSGAASEPTSSPVRKNKADSDSGTEKSKRGKKSVKRAGKTDWTNREWAGKEVRKRLRKRAEYLEIDYIVKLVDGYEEIERYPVEQDKKPDLEPLKIAAYSLRRIHFEQSRLIQMLWEFPLLESIKIAFPALDLKPNQFRRPHFNKHVRWEKLTDDLRSEMRSRLRVLSGVSWIEDLVSRYEAIENEEPAFTSEEELTTLRQMAYPIKEGHLMISRLESALKVSKAPAFDGDSRLVIQAAFPKLGLTTEGFDAELLKETDYHRMVVKILPDGQEKLIHFDKRQPTGPIYWDFLDEIGNYVVKTAHTVSGRVMVHRNIGLQLNHTKQLRARWEREGWQKGHKVYLNIIYEDSIPERIEIYSDKERKKAVSNSIELNPIVHRPRAGQREFLDIRLERYSSEERKKLTSHDVPGTLTPLGNVDFGGLSAEGMGVGRYGVKVGSDGQEFVDPRFQSAPFLVYFNNGFPMWTHFFGKERPRKFFATHVFKRVYSYARGEVVRTFPHYMHLAKFKELLKREEEVWLEGDYIIESSGRIQVSGITFYAPSLAGKPVLVRLNKFGRASARSMVVHEDGEERWDLRFFQRQIEAFIQEERSAVPGDQGLRLPSRMDPGSRTNYQTLYNYGRLSQEGVEKLYREVIYLGDIALEDLFKGLDPAVLDKKVGGRTKEYLVKRILLNMIRQGYTDINEQSVGPEVLELIGGPINLKESGRLGLMPLILRAEAARDLISRSYAYLVSHVLASRKFQPWRILREKELWEEAHASGIMALLDATDGYDVRSLTTEGRPVLFNTYAWKIIERRVMKALEEQIRSITDSEGRHVQSLFKPLAGSAAEDDEWTTLETLGAEEKTSLLGELSAEEMRQRAGTFDEILKEGGIVKRTRDVVWLRILHKLGVESWTHKSIGKRFEVNGSRIKQLESEARETLRQRPDLLIRIGRDVLGLDLDTELVKALMEEEESGSDAAEKRSEIQDTLAIARQATELYDLSDSEYSSGLEKLSTKYNGRVYWVHGDYVIHNNRGILIVGEEARSGKSSLAHALMRAGATMGGSERVDLLRVGSTIIGGISPLTGTVLGYRHLGEVVFTLIEPTERFVPISKVVFTKFDGGAAGTDLRSYESLQKAVPDHSAATHLFETVEGDFTLEKIFGVTLSLESSPEDIDAVANRILTSSASSPVDAAWPIEILQGVVS